MAGNDSTLILEKIKASETQIADFIEESRWNPDLRREQTLCLARYCTAFKATQGDMIFREGATDSSLVIIVRGQISIIKKDSHLHQKPIAVLGPGKTLGEMSLVDGEPRSADAVASANSIVLEITRDSLHRLNDSLPKLGIRILTNIAATISRRLRKTSGQLVEFMS